MTYTPKTFTSSILTIDDLNALAANDQWLYENMTTMAYRAGVSRNGGLKMLVGKTAYGVQTRNDHTNVQVSFGNFFSTGCAPIINVTVYNSGDGRKYASIKAIDSYAEPDHRGFMAHVISLTAAKTVEKSGWLHWQAVGW